MAGPRIVVEMDADESKMWAKLKKLEKAEGGVEKAIKRVSSATKELTREQKQLQRQTDRYFASTRTPLERRNREITKLNMLLRRTTMSQDLHRRAVAKVNAEYHEAEMASARAFGSSTLTNIRRIGSALGVGGVAGALALGAKSFQAWLDNIKQISEATEKASFDIITFAALQEPGTKGERARRVEALRRRYEGVSAEEAFNTVQAIQSARGGDFEAGLEGAKAVFAASEVNLPVALGRELEVLGASQGQAIGAAVRRGFVTGELSGRTPQALGLSAASISQYDDPTLGFAASGILAGAVREEQLQTYAKRAGFALQNTSQLGQLFRRNNLQGASQFERLQFLAGQMADIPEGESRKALIQERLAEFGLGEDLELIAISTLITQIDQLAANMKEINEKAIPGVLTGERIAVEEEMPMFRATRAGGRLAAAYESELVFGDEELAMNRQRIANEQRARAILLKHYGYDQFLGTRLYDETGRSTQMATYLAGLRDDIMKPPRGVSAGEIELMVPMLADLAERAPGTEFDVSQLQPPDIEARRPARWIRPQEPRTPEPTVMQTNDENLETGDAQTSEVIKVEVTNQPRVIPAASSGANTVNRE